MFETMLLDSSASQSPALTRRHRIIATLAATALECLLVGALVLVPLVRTQALDLNGLRSERIVFPPPARAVEIVPIEHETTARPASSLTREKTTIIAPNAIPRTIAQIIDEVPPQVGPDIGVIGGDHNIAGIPGSVLLCILGDTGRSNPPPPTEVTRRGARRIVRGGKVEPAQVIFKRQPDYPALAKVARVQGTVRLEAVIGTDGRIQDLQVISGHPMLVKAALEAVAEWRYQPTMLNGEPVEVQTEIVVNFILGE